MKRSGEDTPPPHLTPASDPSLAAAFRTRGYEIERELGRGGMATVYLAHDVKHDRRVALKVLSPELSTAQLADRFAAEIRVTANLSHPNILPLFDSGNAEGRLYYAMPYLEGDSLRARLERDKQLSVDEAVALLRALAGALEYAHKRGVIHRDIKPENILFQDGQPLLADFGIALALSSVGAERLTSMGVSIGTPQYMSPEQATGEQTVGPPSDIYSLAAVARLSPSEKLHVQGMIAYRTGRSDSAVRLFDAALLEDPSNAMVYHDRGMALRILGRWDDATDSFQRSVERATIRMREGSLNSLATTLAFNGQIDSARVVARRMQPGVERDDAEFYVAIADAEWDTVRRMAHRIASNPSNSPEERSTNLATVAATQVARGQVDAAWRTLDEAEAILPDPFRGAFIDVLIGVPSGIRPGRRRARSPADTLDFQRFFRALWHAWNRDSAAAAVEIREFRKALDPKGNPEHAQQADLFERWITSGPGAQRAVVDRVGPRAWSGHRGMFNGPVLQRWFVADAYERLGRLDSAIVYFELLVRPKRMGFGQGRHLGYGHSFALRRLAQLYDRMGQRAQARRHWQQFLDTFTDPDPEFRPLVAEARAALAKRN